MEKQGWAHKWCTPMDTHIWPSKSRTTSLNSQLCEDTGWSPEDLPEAMNDREKWREKVRDICASGTRWWWWWWRLLYILWHDWPIFIFSGSNELLQQELKYTLLNPDCHCWWISKMQSGYDDTLEERDAIKLCFKIENYATETYGMLQTAFRQSCMRRWTIGRSGERRSGISVPAARHDDDDDDDDDNK